MFENYISKELNIYYQNINNSKIKNILKYSLDGGKCIRGAIVKNIINKLSNNEINIWQPIVSIELIHGISLIIDDLPCMDNDTIRRNKPSTFVKFGERQSILISFYGMSEALKLLVDGINSIDKFSTDKILLNKMLLLINEWNDEIGKNLIIGQLLDLQENIEDLLDIKLQTNNQNIIIYKTASLFSFAFTLGAIYSGKDIDFTDFKKMGYYFGIMFQLMDDFNDITTDSIENNYILSNGKNNSLKLYLDSHNKLINLLKTYNLYNNFFIELIDKLNSQVPIN